MQAPSPPIRPHKRPWRFLLGLSTLIWLLTACFPRTAAAALLAWMLLVIADEAVPHLRRWWSA